MDFSILLILIGGFLVFVIGITIAIIQDKRRNLRVSRLFEKRIVIFEKTKAKIYDEEVFFIKDNAFLRKKGISTGVR